MQVVQFLGMASFLTGGFGIATIVFILLSVFWLWMLIDCLTSNQPPMEKLIWFLVIFFLHILGALLYYFIARQGPRANVV